MKESLVFLEENEVYGARFAGYVERKKLLAGPVKRIRSGAELLALGRAEGIPLLLAEEEAWEKIPGEEQKEIAEFSGKVLLLSETEGGEGEKRICRYQPMSRLLYRLKEEAGDCFRGRPREKTRSECILVCGPAGPEELEACAAAAAHIRAEEGRTVFLSMDPFPGFLLPAEEGAGLSELLYRLRSGTVPENLEHYAVQTGGLEIIPPAASPKDIWELRPEEAERLLRTLTEGNVWETIVTVLGPGRDPGPALAVCGRMLVPVSPTREGLRRKDLFFHYLLESGLELPEMIQEIPVPELPEGSSLDPVLKYTRTGEQLRELLQGIKPIAEMTEIE